MATFRKKAPIVWNCNDVWFMPSQGWNKKAGFFSETGKYLLGLLDKVLIKRITTIVVLDERIKTIVEIYYNKKAIVVHSGVALAYFAKLPNKTIAKKHFGIARKTFVFLCFGIFLPHRRFEDVINAYKKLISDTKNHQLLLIIAGSGEADTSYAAHIKNLAKKTDIKQHTYVDVRYIDPQELLYYFASTDVFIFPNEKETWGLTAIEAMAAGIPTIISTGAGAHKIIQDGKNGLLFPQRDIDTLTMKMRLLLENTTLRKRIAQNGKQFVTNNLSWEKFAAFMGSLFAQSIKNK